MTNNWRRRCVRRGFRLALYAFTFYCVGSFAAPIAPQTEKLPRLSIDDILSMRRILSAQMSPDAKYVAYLVEEAGDATRQHDQWPTSLWTVPAAGGEPQQLARSPRGMSSPQWSPDSSQIAFLARGEDGGHTQLFVTGLNLEAPKQLTHHGTSISSFHWSPDGSRIAFVAPTTHPYSADEEKRIRSGFDAMVLEPYQTTQIHTPNRLSVVSVATGEESSVEIGDLHVMSAKWSPDGATFLLTVTDKPYTDFEQLRPRLMTVAISGGTPVTYCSTVGKITGADWGGGGRFIAFLGSVHGETDFFPGGLFVCEGPGGKPRNLTANAPYTTDTFRVKGDKIVASIAEENHRFLGLIDLHKSGYERLTPSDRVVQFRSDFTLDNNAQSVACVLARWNLPPDIWALTSGVPRQLTHLNPELEHREYGEGREVKWKGKDGLDISGVLILPVGYEPGKRYPLVTHMHGSNGAEANDFQVSSTQWGQMLAAHGFAVLMTNFRGSVTNGAEFVHAFETDLGGADLNDALAGSDAMVKAGIADPNRLGVSGVSYGGYLTASAITNTTKFRAAVMLSGVTNYYSVHTGWSAAPESADRLEWLRNPYDIHDFIWSRSPSAHLSRVKTSTLILWGEFDPAIPVMQAFEIFRGLRHFGVTSKLVVYPREGHVPREVNHVRDMLGRVIEWFQTYLAG
jgi:dipeptidyl aminopeptidase/acylaminoacyl peptidase